MRLSKLAPLLCLSLAACPGLDWWLDHTGHNEPPPHTADAGPDVDAEPVPDAGAIDADPSTACSAGSPSELADCVDGTRYLADLTAIASTRPPDSAHWQAVQDLCADRLGALGYTVERHDYGTGVNVIGVRLGTVAPDEQIVVSAHYDSVADCSGADDNASGVAGLLEAARVLAETELERTVVVACWDEEETGLIGSRAYAQRARDAGDDIVVAISLEMIGYADSAPNSQQLPPGFDSLFPAVAAELASREFRGDFIAAIGDEAAASTTGALRDFAAGAGEVPVVVVQVPTPFLSSPLIGDLRRSDHDSFWQQGYPALMLTDTANLRNPNYHCAAGDDTVADLDHDFAANVIRATVAAVATSAGIAE